MTIPFAVDVTPPRRSWANFVLIAVTTAAFFVTTTGGVLRDDHELALGRSPAGIFGHLLLHADALHLFFDMLAPWVFGNAVCGRLGAGRFLLVYLLGDFVAAMGHQLLDGRPAVGASAAIMGVVGAFVVFHPVDYVSVHLPGRGARDVRAWQLAVLWVALELIGLFTGDGRIGRGAHLAGLGTGALVAVVLLRGGWAGESPSPSLLDLYWR